MISPNLEHLRDLTNRLPRYLDLVGYRSDSCDVIRTQSGTLLSFPLFKHDDCAICRGFASAGTSMGEHIHDRQREWLLVMSGRMEVQETNGPTKDVGKHDGYLVEVGVPHRTSWPEDTWFIAITMPADPGFPNAK